jgi:hypothetical protein
MNLSYNLLKCLESRPATNHKRDSQLFVVSQKDFPVIDAATNERPIQVPMELLPQAPR